MSCIIEVVIIADPLEKTLAREAQRVDEAHARMLTLDIAALDKKVHLLGIALHHIERMESVLSSKRLAMAKELNKLLGDVTSKQKGAKNAYSQAKRDGTAKEKKDVRVALSLVKKDVQAIRALKENLARYCKQNISTEMLVSKEATSGLGKR